MTAYIIIAQNGEPILNSLRPLRRDAVQYITGKDKEKDWPGWKAVGYEVKRCKITIMP